MQIYTPLNIEKFFNNRGFTSKNDIAKGNLTLGNSSFPLDKFPLENPIIYKGIPFCFYHNLYGDNIELSGQKITFPSLNSNKLHIIGNSSNGNLSDYIYILNQNNIMSKVKIKLTCLTETTPFFNNECFWKFDYLHNPLEGSNINSGVLWYVSIDIKDVINFDSFEFPDNPFIHIFAITVESFIEK